jgi:hypothetical protein
MGTADVRVTDEPDDLFRRHAAVKASGRGRLLAALGVVTERELGDETGDEGEREEPRTPAA